MTYYLNVNYPNVQTITTDLITILQNAELILQEAQGTETPYLNQTRGRRGNNLQQRGVPESINSLFPIVRIPTAPPPLSPTLDRQVGRQQRVPIPTRPTTIGNVDTFIMQLSAFDCSHRSGIPGTPEVLIPLDAQSFFPEVTQEANRRHPDVNFDVILNTPIGQDRHNYRVWYYEARSELRLRMNHDTIDLSTEGGGDLLVINKLPDGSEPRYEVTILSHTDPTYQDFLGFCTNESNGKRWGMGRL